MKIFLFVAILFHYHSTHSQTIYKNWSSEEFGICINLRSNGFFTIDEINNYKSKINRKGILKIFFYPAPSSSNKRYVSKFRIEELTENKLILNPISKKIYVSDMPKLRIHFIIVPEQCE